MKAGGKNTVKLVAVFLVAMLLSNNVFAKDLLGCTNVKNTIADVPEKMVQSLAMGIASDNQGLKRSCIYFAGFYEIDGLVKPLVTQLKKETDPGTRILIALALYKIGGTEAMDAVEKLAKNDGNSKVKRISNAILNEFQLVSNTITKK